MEDKTEGRAKTLFEWKHLDIVVPNNNPRYEEKKIKLISNACGKIDTGLLAIMGPSGSGKTTLLNAFVGRIPDGSITTGDVLYNGKSRDNSTWKNNIGFVNQDDTIYEDLTARQTVEYAAKFRLSTKCENLQDKIDELFDNLSIRYISETKMNSLSGGERKRVMIAVELITDPQIIFLDEPTSGLDNVTSNKLIKLLRKISDEGKTVIFTIHQPDEIAIREFSQILLLSQGRTIYMGDFKNCENYLNGNGYRREDLESFSNFAMRILNVTPGVYHESESETQLSKLASDMQKIHKFDPTLKVENSKNNRRFDFSIRFDHVLLILKRKVKLHSLQQKSLVLFGLNIAFQAVFLLVFKKMYAMQGLPGGLNSRYVTEAELSIKSGLVPFIFASMPVVAGSAFYPETEQVKREIGVFTYSIASYYLASLIYESLVFSIPLLFFSIGAFFILPNIAKYVEILLPGLIVCFGSLVFYLFCGSITSSKKLTSFLVGFGFTANICPISDLVNSFVRGNAVNKSKWFCLLDILPTYLLSNIVKRQTILENYEDLQENMVDKMKLMRSFLPPHLVDE